MSLNRYLNDRQLGNSRQLLHGSLLNQLWGKANGDAKDPKNINLGVHGMGIFGLKYSPDGKLLVAACENNTISVVEPYSQKRLKRFNTHSASCNTVTFFNDYYFCVSSDDGIISVFDIRNLDIKVYSLHGVHEGWIKNVEYSPKDHKLISSDLYGEVHAWDLTKPTICSSLKSKQLLNVDNLLRMRMSPCGSSMYLSSVSPPGIIAIHNLDIYELANKVRNLENDPTRQSVLTYGDDGKTSFDRCMGRQELLCRPIRNEKNYVEVYYNHQLEQGFNSEVECLNCLSMEIHPQNKCIVGTYQNLENSRPKSQITAVQNLCNYYRGPYEGCNSFPLENLLQEREDERRQIRRSKRLKRRRIDAQTSTLFNNVWKKNELRHPCPPTQVSPSQRAEIPTARGQMTHYVGEMDMELSDYIQELSFSADARFVAAPDRHDLRIFAFDEKGSDYTTAVNNLFDDGVDYHKGKHFTAFGIPKPKQMEELICLKGHQSPVLSCAFSPATMQVASGSLHGQLILHEPKL